MECGKSGSGMGTTHAAELIESCLSIAQLPSHDVVPNDVDLYRTYAIVKRRFIRVCPSTARPPSSAFDPTLIS